jgi:hypothetical protein
MNYFSSGFIFLLWCGRPTSYVPCGQLYCSCICNCDWIEWLRLICDFATRWCLGCNYATTSSCVQWRGHVISHCLVVQVAATCWILVSGEYMVCVCVCVCVSLSKEWTPSSAETPSWLNCVARCQRIGTCRFSRISMIIKSTPPRFFITPSNVWGRSSLC